MKTRASVEVPSEAGYSGWITTSIAPKDRPTLNPKPRKPKPLKGPKAYTLSPKDRLWALDFVSQSSKSERLLL